MPEPSLQLNKFLCAQAQSLIEPFCQGPDFEQGLALALSPLCSKACAEHCDFDPRKISHFMLLAASEFPQSANAASPDAFYLGFAEGLARLPGFEPRLLAGHFSFSEPADCDDIARNPTAAQFLMGLKAPVCACACGLACSEFGDGLEMSGALQRLCCLFPEGALLWIAAGAPARARDRAGRNALSYLAELPSWTPAHFRIASLFEPADCPRFSGNPRSSLTWAACRSHNPQAAAFFCRLDPGMQTPQAVASARAHFENEQTTESRLMRAALDERAASLCKQELLAQRERSDLCAFAALRALAEQGRLVLSLDGKNVSLSELAGLQNHPMPKKSL